MCLSSLTALTTSSLKNSVDKTIKKFNTKFLDHVFLVTGVDIWSLMEFALYFV